MLMLSSWGCAECECTCRCNQAGTEHEDTFVVEEEGDCDGECDAFIADNCPAASSESFSVDCS